MAWVICSGNTVNILNVNEETCGDNCISVDSMMSTTVSDITTVSDFKKTMVSELTDVKNWKTQSSYPTLKLVYDRYMNSVEYCDTESSKFTYNDMSKFSELVGTYWVDLIEQVVPSTTIWGSTYVYGNTFWDQQKFKYKKYSLITCDESIINSDVVSPSSGWTNDVDVELTTLQNIDTYNTVSGSTTGDSFTDITYIRNTSNDTNVTCVVNNNVNTRNCIGVGIIQSNCGSEFIGTLTIDGDTIITDPCEDVICPIGQECINGTCVDIDPCEGITCPIGQECINGTCVDIDPCEGITCPIGQECINGTCVDITYEPIIWLDIDDETSFTHSYNQYADIQEIDSITNKGSLGGNFIIIDDNDVVDTDNDLVEYHNTVKGINTFSIIQTPIEPAYVKYESNIDILSGPVTMLVTFTELDSDNNTYYGSLGNNSESHIDFYGAKPGGTTSLDIGATTPQTYNYVSESSAGNPIKTQAISYDGTNIFNQYYSVQQYTNSFNGGLFSSGDTILSVLNRGNDTVMNNAYVHEIRVYNVELSQVKINELQTEMTNKYI